MAGQIITKLRDFPSVELLLQDEKLAKAVKSVPRPVASETIKQVIAVLKEELGRGETAVSIDRLYEEVRSEIFVHAQKQIRPVINATGIVVHTNLGRSPISKEMFDSIRDMVTGYSNVEFDLNGGSRGSRGEACEQYLSMMAGSEAATVVNNCAAALFLVLNTLSNRKEVIISRGELVQIGGGFRIPDILRKSGAKLREVGSTNITTLEDYESAVSGKTGLILKVHQSNFAQAGFTKEVNIKRLATLARKSSVPIVNDLGSGVLVPTTAILGHKEPTVQESVQHGADLTCFSGDKLLGGMQSGLIVGQSEMISRIKKNPIFRTMRVDKLSFAMLEKLLTAYLNGDQLENVKLWKILLIPESELYRRAKSILKSLGNPPELSVEATSAYVGGGALPELAVPSVGIAFSKQVSANRLIGLFREADPPIIGRIEDERFILDIKTVDESHLAHLAKIIKRALK